MKKALKVLGWIVGVFLVLVIVAIVALRLFFPLEKAKAYAIERGSTTMGRPISVDDVDISLWGGLGVRLVGVSVGNPEDLGGGELLTADDIDVKLRLFPLLSGSYRVDRLIVNKPEITLVKRKDGSNNYTFAGFEQRVPVGVTETIPPETKAAVLVVTFDKLEINDGNLVFADDSSNVTVSLRNLNLSTTLENPRGGLYRSSGNISVDSLTASGDMGLPPLSVDLGYRASYDLDRQHVVLEEAELGLNGLEFVLQGEATSPLDAVKGRLGIKCDKISVADISRLIPANYADVLKDYDIDGDFSLDVDIEYDAARREKLAYYGTAVITSMSVATEKVPAKFKFKRALLDFKNDNLRMNIEEGAFDGEPFKGHLVVDDFDDPTINGELAGRLNLAYVQPFLPAEDRHEISGEAQFDIKLSGKASDFRAIRFSGNLSVTHGRYNSLLLPEPVEAFHLDLYFDNRVANVRKFAAQTNSGRLAFNGRINDLIPYLMADSAAAGEILPIVDGQLEGRLDLAALSSFLPQEGSPQLEGQLDLKLSLGGVLTDFTGLKPRGTVSITNGSYSDSLLPEPLEQFEAELVIAPDTISVKKMNARFVSSDASFSGRLVNPFPYLLPVKDLDRSKVPKPLFLFSLSSTRFDVDRLFPEAVPGSGGEQLAAVSMDSISAIILPDIDGAGTFRIDTVVYCKVEFTGIDGKIKIHDRKIECYDVTGEVYTGDVSGRTTIDLSDFRNPRYAGDFKATQIEADDFMNRFTKFGGHLFGKIDLNGAYNAAGRDAESFLNSLTMNSTSTMQRGKLVTSGVVHSLISGLAQKVGQPFSKEQPLRDLSTNIIVSDGKVRLDKLKTRLGKMGDLELDGFYAFSGEIDYSGSMLLSKEWSEKLLSKGGLLGGLAGLLTDKSAERVKLPIAMGGTMDNPSLAVNYSSLTKNVGENISKDLGDFLNGLIKKKDKK